MSEYKLTVGLEIHVELETKTKMFCGCLNEPFESAPNTNVCPVCYGLPGALPLINKEAVKMVIRLGRAINATIPEKTQWERKNYFYPDLPKGYQISQSVAPLIQGGVITINGVDHHLDHAHLEEDAGKLMHAPDKSHSMVNYNRAGVPLLEIVTKPDFHSAEDVKAFCQELQRIMRSLKISSADMEKGRMRCEANISVKKVEELNPGELRSLTKVLGTKVEVKNINSFRGIERAVKYEFDRQYRALENGDKLFQETRTWNDDQGKTISMRVKETGADYRYFPEPDLPVVDLSSFVDEGTHLLPDEQRKMLAKLEIHNEAIQAIIDKDGFEMVMELGRENAQLAREAAKVFLAVPEFSQLPKDQQKQLIEKKEELGLTSTRTKEIIIEALKSGTEISKLLEQSDSIDLAAIVDQVITDFPKEVAQYKDGKEVLFNFLVGQVMAKTKGQANIAQVRELLQNQLS
ncbi:Asp-tRNA(Asn)/Glu-tRNA(Gln) amidotransferase subunit GatB [Candidatus Berkelbacteria bacterium]|nr:Asp-tRNA(Asn)/Glu-tRNA(Gln) amidotransferase subunit GatB [Candidatus Berkelbacteria bacterium]